MTVIELILVGPQSALKMTSSAKKRIKSPPYEPPGLTEHERLYIKALEQEFIEQRLRVQLYQTVISQAFHLTAIHLTDAPLFSNLKNSHSI
jgi:hypothetical protein